MRVDWTCWAETGLKLLLVVEFHVYAVSCWLVPKGVALVELALMYLSLELRAVSLPPAQP